MGGESGLHRTGILTMVVEGEKTLCSTRGLHRRETRLRLFKRSL